MSVCCSGLDLRQEGTYTGENAHGEPVTVAVVECPEGPDPQVKEEADLGHTTAGQGPTPLLASHSPVF